MKIRGLPILAPAACLSATQGGSRPLCAELERVAQTLSQKSGALRFGSPVAFTYNPLEYAWEAHRAYLARARSKPVALFVGMNPGPFGMAQTGVPFGEVNAVLDFLGIDERVARITSPIRTHPKRPIDGFACTRSEVSGARVWAWARERFGTADAFFDGAFIWNWCPLAFLAASGANLTPDKLPRAGRGSASVKALERACDEALAAVIAALEPKHLIGFGAFATKRAQRVMDGMNGMEARSKRPEIHQVLHPSPASPAANRGWARQVEDQLAKAGVEFARRARVKADGSKKVGCAR